MLECFRDAAGSRCAGIRILAPNGQCVNVVRTKNVQFNDFHPGAQL